MQKLKKEMVSKIFSKLKEGNFLCGDSPNKEERRLFGYIETNAKELQAYFDLLGIDLKIKDGYAYFASRGNIEQKLARIEELIDILSFFYSYDNNFDIGYRFMLGQIELLLRSDDTLRYQIEQITKEGDLRQRIEEVVTKLERFGIVALEDSYTKRYKVLSSLGYMVRFLETIKESDG